MAKPKLLGLLRFKLGKPDHFDLAAENLDDTVDVQKVDGGAAVTWGEKDIDWTFKVLGNNRLRIEGTPRKIKGTPRKRSKSRDGDLVGDLTVTIEPGTAPTDSVTISNVVYEEP